ncbi:organic cation transporter protein-like isoform X5 [Dermacentor albipictus]|uniref:organic cation transporter protein-like isoform X5 n=1 Tax=Dermacentor albipictus TaxID=60249 RepID=UPI0031FD1793
MRERPNVDCRTERSPGAGDGSAEESEQLVETICNGGSTTHKAMLKEEKVELTSIFGAYGPFQRIVFLFAVTISMFGAYHNLIITAVAPKIDHWCARPAGHGYENMTDEEWKELAIPKETRQGVERYSQCQRYDFETNATVSCNSWEYDRSIYKNTIVDQWDLVCSSSWLISLSQSVYMAGYMTSMIIFGQLSDRVGRRTVICIALSILLTAGFSTLLSRTFITFISLRYFVSLGVSGVGATSFVLLMEVTGPTTRSFFGLAYEFGWATGYLVLALVAYLIKNWFYVQLVAMIGALVLIIGFWVLPESPRWLMANKKFDQAHKLIMEAVERNEKDKEEAEIKYEQLKKEFEKEQPKHVFGKATVFDLLKTPVLRRRTLILYFCWFVNSFTYYAMSLNTNDLGGNPYLNFAIAGAVEFPAYAISIVVIQKMGRRWSQSGCMLLAGIACIVTIFFQGKTLWLKITFAMIGKFLITASYGILYVYSAEIYPTVVRNVGVGSSSTIARFGAIIAPFVKELGHATHESVPFGVYGAICISSGLTVLLLPETRGAQLPDSVVEGEEFLGPDAPSRSKVSEDRASNKTKEEASKA